MAPDVTVIISAHGAAPYLAGWLASVAAQSLAAHRIDVVVVDDGPSTHTSVELRSRKGSRRVRRVHQPQVSSPGQLCNVGLPLSGAATCASSTPATGSAPMLCGR
ncbi:glycosyltransferase [Streptomyces xanthochromogenes]|uniref:glycosyltransferase n=1 Tax=Streptomyces xanthochromogenes TaxID=67384 RepID=UPI00342EDEED